MAASTATLPSANGLVNATAGTGTDSSEKVFAWRTDVPLVSSTNRVRRLYAVAEANVSSEPAPRTETQAITLVPAQATSQLLAEWHGQVVDVLSSTFTAQLKGRHGEGVAGKEEEAVIPIEEVRPEDQDLLEPGAFFRLCISYERSPQGSKRRYTEVVFRRLPAYRRDELEQAQARGRELARGLRLE